LGHGYVARGMRQEDDTPAAAYDNVLPLNGGGGVRIQKPSPRAEAEAKAEAEAERM